MSKRLIFFFFKYFLKIYVRYNVQTYYLTPQLNLAHKDNYIRGLWQNAPEPGPINSAYTVNIQLLCFKHKY